MTPLELEYVRTCTQSHKRDIATASSLVALNSGLLDMATIVRLLDRADHGISQMFITLKAETPEVKDND